MRKFQVITLFPEMFTGVFENSMMWKAQRDEIVQLSTINLRDYGLGPRKSVDDTPYGGGDGMLLMIEPLWQAVQAAKANDPDAKVLLMTPRGVRWQQAMAHDYSEQEHGYIFICGRYEGYDERILTLVDAELSVGDYVLTGGELPAMTIIDSIVRLIPGVLGGENDFVNVLLRGVEAAIDRESPGDVGRVTGHFATGVDQHQRVVVEDFVVGDVVQHAGVGTAGDDGRVGVGIGAASAKFVGQFGFEFVFG